MPKGKYRLSAWGSKEAGYVGALICDDHDHPTFDEAQQCVLASLRYGRPEVLEGDDTATEPSGGAAGQEDTSLALPEDTGPWPLPGV